VVNFRRTPWSTSLKTGSKHSLDDYFKRYALVNDRAGIGRAYVLRRDADDNAEHPRVLGFYTLSMALVESAFVSEVLKMRLPKYPMPVALIGRLAIHERAQGHRLGEKLLMDALRRTVDAANLLGCTGGIVDAKDEGAEYPRLMWTQMKPERATDTLGTADGEGDALSAQCSRLSATCWILKSGPH
jgi:GNAT superfamily N-acetyltransferase